jgi:hypothetical protein
MTRKVLDSRRQVMSTVVCAYPGGRECAAARLGLPVKRLDNQVYESNGCQPLTDAQLHLLEQETATSYLPDYICALYGGVFVPMPESTPLENLDLYARALATDVAEGKVNQIIAQALRDGRLDEAELAEIVAAHRQHIATRHAEVSAVITLHRK